MAKLYSNMSRFVVRSRMRKSTFKKLQWGLTLNIGDLINDCTGFNCEILSIEPQYTTFHSGWRIVDFDLTTSPHNNLCSLINCCSDSQSREEIEKEKYEWLKYYFPKEFERYMAGSSPEDYTKYNKYYQKLILALENGIHICDERGCILSDFIL